MSVLNIYKPLGLSPLDTIKLLKEGSGEYKGERITYAGRLDPMAEGVLLLLFGDSLSEKDKYLNLSKEYEAEFLFGFKTDTFDILGLPNNYLGVGHLSEEKIKKVLEDLRGGFNFQLPPYSSYKIKGQPLFWWARQGRLSEVEIPKREVEIEEVKVLDFYSINKSELGSLIINKINLVSGDFRQEEIKSTWQKVLSSSNKPSYQVVKVKINCSSGTYIRSIADEVGKTLDTGATLLSLTRTKVGTFTIKDSKIL